jgi:hypothetical protein
MLPEAVLLPGWLACALFNIHVSLSAPFALKNTRKLTMYEEMLSVAL